ncbi:MAG: chemotaxis protein CheZ [Rhodospirillaceae bacterium]|nr:MAG: chemotaxis protein CheZ [Rhodospirillaceae bacterium]
MTGPKAKGQNKSIKTTQSKPLSRKGSEAIDLVVASAKSSQKSSKQKFTKAEQNVMLELEHLADYIHAAKVEIGQIRPDDVKDDFLPSAKDELDAVVGAAADATNAIMDSCEIIEKVMGDVSQSSADQLMDATTRIYEACTFQDITGQRINKVVTTLQHIEHRIDALVNVFGDEISKSHKKTETEPAQTVDAGDFLEGPQRADKAKSQSEIDDLLASFD